MNPNDEIDRYHVVDMEFYAMMTDELRTVINKYRLPCYMVIASLEYLKTDIAVRAVEKDRKANEDDAR